MSSFRKSFGEINSEPKIELFTLKNSNGMETNITNYGGAIVSLNVPDRNGKFEDVVLGYDDLYSYIKGNKFFGAIIGRCGNRIRNGKFKINSVVYDLPLNDGPNHLHGGLNGYDKVIWSASFNEDSHNKLTLSYCSPDGEEGYPGNLKVKVTYTLDEDNAIIIDYEGISDMDTIINLTNHSYFNLSGHSSGEILTEKLFINADTFTPSDSLSVPTGEVSTVFNTPMDFTNLKSIGLNINDTDYTQIKYGSGYDHNWILNTKGNISIKAAQLVDEKSGRIMDVYTTSPCVQFYSSNFLNGSDIGKDGAIYEYRNGVCLETQFVPNSINLDNFKSPLFKANEKYKHRTIYKFSAL